jgi:hypothetical protein
MAPGGERVLKTAARCSPGRGFESHPLRSSPLASSPRGGGPVAPSTASTSKPFRRDSLHGLGQSGRAYADAKLGVTGIPFSAYGDHPEQDILGALVEVDCSATCTALLADRYLMARGWRSIGHMGGELPYWITPVSSKPWRA